jgi:membrane-associated phospholipid phosphatase
MRGSVATATPRYLAERATASRANRANAAVRLESADVIEPHGGVRLREPLRRPPFRGTATPVVTVRHSVRRLVLVGVLAAVLCALLYVGAVLTPAGQFIGDLILYGRPRSGGRVRILASETLETINVTMLVIATSALAAIAVARGRIRLALAVVVAVAGANVTSQFLKHVLLERPNLLGDTAFATGNSFPSGHVTVAASLVLAALLVVPRPLRAVAAIAGAGYVALVGMSTIAAGWHRLDDAVGAVLIALAWSALVAAAVARGWSFMPRRTWSFGAARHTTLLLVVGGAATVLTGGAVLAYAWINPEVANLGGVGLDRLRVFVAAAAVIAGASLGACGALLWAMRGIVLERRE